MSKKKKDVCPYCGGEFIYISRHKCKVRARIESNDIETEQDRRQTRINFIRKEITRKLKKNEVSVLEIIMKEGEILIEELQKKANLSSDKLEKILEVLELKTKIKVQRELVEANWTKRILYAEEINKIHVKESKTEIDKRKDDFIWDVYSRMPCFLCVYIDRCDNSQTKFNPYICAWLTDWIWHCLDKSFYQNPFNGTKKDF